MTANIALVVRWIFLESITYFRTFRLFTYVMIPQIHEVRLSSKLQGRSNADPYTQGNFNDLVQV